MAVADNQLSTDMTTCIPSLFTLPETVRSLLIHTGNIINWNELKRKTSQTTTDELLESIGFALSSWSSELNVQQFQGEKFVDCVNTKFVEQVDKDSRKDLKVIVKILLCQLDVRALEEAVNQVLQVLGIDFLESVVVAFPPLNTGALELYHIQPIWTILENFVQAGRIVTIGVSDLDTETLIALYQWSTVKPSTNQVNLASCCVMPPEMTAFAKDHDIQLLTHNDPKEILPIELSVNVLKEKGRLDDAAEWGPTWIARYSVLVKCRGVIQNKGYSACFRRSVLSRTDPKTAIWQ